MEESPSGQVEEKPVAGSAQAPRQQAGFAQPVTNFFRRILKTLSSRLQYAIDFNGDLPNQNLLLALVAKLERGADNEASKVIDSFSELLIGESSEQRDKFCLKPRCVDNEPSERDCDRVRF
jgi:hypothetical protein